MSSKAKILLHIITIVAVFFWASAFPAVKYCLQYYSPEAIMLFRFLVASVVLLLYCFVKKTGLPEKADLPLFSITGGVGIFAYMWFFNTGTAMVDSGVSSFIIASAPVFTLLLSVIFLKEKTGLPGWVGIFVSSLGLLLITSNQSSRLEFNRGTVLLVMAAASTALYNILQRKLLKKYSPIQVTTVAVIFATIPMLLFLPLFVTEFPKAPIFADLVIVYLGVFPAAISYFLWGYALSKAEKTIHVTSFLYLTPFIATLMAYFWLHETLALASFAGGVVIILGMAITNFKKETVNESA